MDKEQIIFLVIALAFTIFSMIMKSKKQKRAVQSEDIFHSDSLEESDLLKSFESEMIFEPYDVIKSSQNSDFSMKENKKKQKLQNIKTTISPDKTAKPDSQNVDIENETLLLMDFDGTEIQKAFLYSEIFKNVKN
jgi:hypothetical protein